MQLRIAGLAHSSIPDIDLGHLCTGVPALPRKEVLTGRVTSCPGPPRNGLFQIVVQLLWTPAAKKRLPRINIRDPLFMPPTRLTAWRYSGSINRAGAVVLTVYKHVTSYFSPCGRTKIGFRAQPRMDSWRSYDNRKQTLAGRIASGGEVLSDSSISAAILLGAVTFGRLLA